MTGKVILTNVIKGTPFNESRKTSCRCLSTENAEKMFEILVLRCFLYIQTLIFSMSLDLDKTGARNSGASNDEQIVFKDKL